jgi:hypothetical protein
LVLPTSILGIVVDGADRTEIPVMSDIGDDTDYQSDMSTVSVQFTGFESHKHGVMAYEWAVGTTPGGEEIQPFMPHGIIHKEEKDVKGDGRLCMTVVPPLTRGHPSYQVRVQIVNIQ